MTTQTTEYKAIKANVSDIVDIFLTNWCDTLIIE